MFEDTGLYSQMRILVGATSWGEQQDVTRRSNGYAAAEGVDPNDWLHRRQAPAPPPLVNEAVTRQLSLILRGERVCSLPPHVLR